MCAFMQARVIELSTFSLFAAAGSLLRDSQGGGVVQAASGALVAAASVTNSVRRLVDDVIVTIASPAVAE